MSAGGHNRHPDTIRTRALWMLKDGYTVQHIAKNLEVSETAIRKWRDHKAVDHRPELPEGIKMLQAWPRLENE